MLTFRSPHSYTGQDVVELQTHGGPAVMRRVLDACLSAGARSAGPGEFTLRAYLNGRIDLAQAEAVLDLVNASSDAGLPVSFALVSGNATIDGQKLTARAVGSIAVRAYNTGNAMYASASAEATIAAREKQTIAFPVPSTPVAINRKPSE